MNKNEFLFWNWDPKWSERCSLLQNTLDPLFCIFKNPLLSFCHLTKRGLTSCSTKVFVLLSLPNAKKCYLCCYLSMYSTMFIFSGLPKTLTRKWTKQLSLMDLELLVQVKSLLFKSGLSLQLGVVLITGYILLFIFL